MWIKWRPFCAGEPHLKALSSFGRFNFTISRFWLLGRCWLIIHLLEKSMSQAAASPFNVKSNSNNLWLILSPLLLPQVDNPTGKTPTTLHRLQPSSFRLTGGWRKITSKGKGWGKNETKIRRDATWYLSAVSNIQYVGKKLTARFEVTLGMCLPDPELWTTFLCVHWAFKVFVWEQDRRLIFLWGRCLTFNKRIKSWVAWQTLTDHQLDGNDMNWTGLCHVRQKSTVSLALFTQACSHRHRGY